MNWKKIKVKDKSTYRNHFHAHTWVERRRFYVRIERMHWFMSELYFVRLIS